MGCNGCQEKERSRYAVKNVLGQSKPDKERDLQMTGNNPQLIKPSITGSGNPLMDVDKLNKLPYSQIKESTQEFKKGLQEAFEKQIDHMSQDFKRTLFEDLIEAINCTITVPGASAPDQAAALAHKLIHRPDFDFIEELYPGIRDKIDARQLEFKKRCIEL